jgi:hypothetical protein
VKKRYDEEHINNIKLFLEENKKDKKFLTQAGNYQDENNTTPLYVLVGLENKSD